MHGLCKTVGVCASGCVLCIHWHGETHISIIHLVCFSIKYSGIHSSLSLTCRDYRRCSDGTHYCGFTVNLHAAVVPARRNYECATVVTDEQVMLMAQFLLRVSRSLTVDNGRNV